MKKIILSCAAALLAIGSAHATPKFLSLNNKHGKTTIKIEMAHPIFIGGTHKSLLT